MSDNYVNLVSRTFYEFVDCILGILEIQDFVVSAAYFFQGFAISEILLSRQNFVWELVWWDGFYVEGIIGVPFVYS